MDLEKRIRDLEHQVYILINAYLSLANRTMQERIRERQEQQEQEPAAPSEPQAAQAEAARSVPFNFAYSSLPFNSDLAILEGLPDDLRFRIGKMVQELRQAGATVNLYPTAQEQNQQQAEEYSSGKECDCSKCTWQRWLRSAGL